MFPFVMTRLGAAVNALSGAIATRTSREQNHQAIEQYEILNRELTERYNNLVKLYQQVTSDRDERVSEIEKRITHLEAERQLLYSVINLQQELIVLMEKLAQNISEEELNNFERAIEETNLVLKELDRNLIPISSDYLNTLRNRVKQSSIVVQKSNLPIHYIARSSKTIQQKFYLEDCLL